MRSSGRREPCSGSRRTAPEALRSLSGSPAGHRIGHRCSGETLGGYLVSEAKCCGRDLPVRGRAIGIALGKTVGGRCRMTCTSHRDRPLVTTALSGKAARWNGGRSVLLARCREGGRLGKRQADRYHRGNTGSAADISHFSSLPDRRPVIASPAGEAEGGGEGHRVLRVSLLGYNLSALRRGDRTRLGRYSVLGVVAIHRGRPPLTTSPAGGGANRRAQNMLSQARAVGAVCRQNRRAIGFTRTSRSDRSCGSRKHRLLKYPRGHSFPQPVHSFATQRAELI